MVHRSLKINDCIMYDNPLLFYLKYRYVLRFRKNTDSWTHSCRGEAPWFIKLDFCLRSKKCSLYLATVARSLCEVKPSIFVPRSVSRIRTDICYLALLTLTVDQKWVSVPQRLHHVGICNAKSHNTESHM